MKSNILMLVLSLIFWIGCQNKDNTIVNTPTNLNCGSNATACNGQVYNQQNGFQPYNNQYNNYGNPNSLCGCPAGYRPVYNGSWGMGCMSNQLIYPQTYGTNTMLVGWTWVVGSGWLNIPQTPYESSVPSPNPYSNSCYDQVLATCDSRQANTCGAGNICRPIGGGSLIGTCVKETF